MSEPRITKLPNGLYVLAGTRYCSELECKEFGCSFPDCHQLLSPPLPKCQVKDILKMLKIAIDRDGLQWYQLEIVMDCDPFPMEFLTPNNGSNKNVH